MKKIETEYFGKKLVLETDHIAKQANGSVMVTYGETVVLVAATTETKDSDMDFFPLTCVYQVRTYSQGRIAGGFVKRERMPSEHEVLASRIIDRPLRPLFAEGFSRETQVIATVLSYDDTSNPIVASMLGASAALFISDIPYVSPVAGINVGRINGEFVVNPSPADLEESDLDLFVVAKQDAIVMVEGESKDVSEKEIVEALDFAYESVQPLLELQAKLQKEVGKEKLTFTPPQDLSDLKKTVGKKAKKKLEKAIDINDKLERQKAILGITTELCEELLTDEAENTEGEIKTVVHELEKEIIRKNILDKKKRIGGRSFTEVRPITCETGILPKAHGSALFTRGETQAMIVTTLGTKDDEQMVDDPSGLYYKHFYLHYNFPAYSVGEVRRMGPPGRREIGHGNLAERSLTSVMPSRDSFPYTIRVVSEITESNGSSSMASVCGASLSMMDAGVPISTPVAGVAMGLVQEGKKTA
ncbi:MAG: polyribonucleotide nucleotidyltransferase, partial [Proteobacteria bacterium]|nr:polyribonucleotide nucleotidyltransferase [Pseudomonadota bacterium]